MLRFGLVLGAAVAVPYLVSRFVYRDHAVRFPWRGGGRWRPVQWVWLAAVLVVVLVASRGRRRWARARRD